MKPFNIELAKQGKPVCTRDGRKARIICFDAKRKDEKNIIALVSSKDYPGFEDLIAYPNNGNYHGGHENDGDLMMFSEKKEGWINIYPNSTKAEIYLDSTGGNIYPTKELAECYSSPDCIATIKVEWEE